MKLFLVVLVCLILILSYPQHCFNCFFGSKMAVKLYSSADRYKTRLPITLRIFCHRKSLSKCWPQAAASAQDVEVSWLVGFKDKAPPPHSILTQPLTSRHFLPPPSVSLWATVCSCQYASPHRAEEKGDRPGINL